MDHRPSSLSHPEERAKKAKLEETNPGFKENRYTPREQEPESNTNTNEGAPSESINTEQAPTPLNNNQTQATDAEKEILTTILAFLVDGSFNMDYHQAYIGHHRLEEKHTQERSKHSRSKRNIGYGIEKEKSNAKTQDERIDAVPIKQIKHPRIRPPSPSPDKQ